MFNKSSIILKAVLFSVILGKNFIKCEQEPESIELAPKMRPTNITYFSYYTVFALDTFVNVNKVKISIYLNDIVSYLGLLKNQINCLVYSFGDLEQIKAPINRIAQLVGEVCACINDLVRDGQQESVRNLFDPNPQSNVPYTDYVTELVRKPQVNDEIDQFEMINEKLRNCNFKIILLQYELTNIRVVAVTPPGDIKSQQAKVLFEKMINVIAYTVYTITNVIDPIIMFVSALLAYLQAYAPGRSGHIGFDQEDYADFLTEFARRSSALIDFTKV